MDRLKKTTLQSGMLFQPNDSLSCESMKGTLCENCQVHGIAICASLDETMLRELDSITSDKKLDTNQELVQEGDIKKYVFTLRSGMLRLVSTLFDGRRQISGFIMPGEFIGLIAEDYYTQTIEAVIPSTLCVFPRHELDQMMELYPQMRERLFEMTRKSLSRSRENQLLLGRLTPIEKMANFLLMSSKRATESGLIDNPVNLVMNRSDIADHLGLTIETVSRCFSKLKTQGVIRLIDTHTVQLLDRATLQHLSGMRDKPA
ncbi:MULTISPECIES: helix-turn-helix domain-containing protein [unclassified Bartonella]|uniref:helix-turn-helix domain-containing protein n=1 Tax=unclassified Bartonella TaxID=2645622 RepID=UPI0021C80B5F|nr:MULTISPECIES: helix-turn-helix domain-containing protein [unclassified Bartonella]UXN04160.1 helix-turn-helix domain-containing protein [Bartonella sp. HY406]UXN07149.1 helix-turn-helix domain-containing protein [Bartonella sp. HY761]